MIDKKEVILITDMAAYGIDNIKKLLDEGKTILLAVEIGESGKESLSKGYMDFLQAKIELKEEKENCGTCGCGKPANALVYLYR